MEPTPSWPPPEVGRAGPGEDGTWVSPGYRSSSRRAAVAIVLVGVAVAADAVGTLLDLQGIGLVDAAEAGTLAESEAIAFDELYLMVANVQTALFLASAVGVLAWLSRVVDNVPPLTGRTPRRGPRAAIGWWFVPFANYVVPYQITADAVRRLRVERDDGTGRLLLPWWIVWIAASLVGSVLWRLPSDTLDDLRLTFTLTALNDAANVVAGILLILIIRGTERRSDARARLPGFGRPPGPPPPSPFDT
jgi:hypothetical protein